MDVIIVSIYIIDIIVNIQQFLYISQYYITILWYDICLTIIII